MAGASSTIVAPSPTTRGGITIPGVEIFATGKYRGRKWNVADLEQMTENFRKLGPSGLKLLTPPAVLGHEETQEFLERTDLPAAGWVSRVYIQRYSDRNGPQAILKVDFSEVPASVARLIKGKAYRKVSAEVYENFTDDHGNGYGKALRRVALLGGEIPQIKRLADIPTNFSEADDARVYVATLCRGESLRSKRVSGVIHVFMEILPMDRNAMVQQALSAGLDQAVIDTMTDDQLAAVVKVLPAPVVEMEESPMSREDMIAELVAKGEDPAALESKTDEELKAMLMPVEEMADMTRDEMIAKLIEQGGNPDELSAKTDEELKAMLEPKPVDVVPMSEKGKKVVPPSVKSLSATVEANLKAELAASLKRQAQQKRSDAEAFCERLVRDGKISPGQKPHYVELLSSKDDRTACHKFSDATVTSYEKAKRELAALPVIHHYGEKIPGSKPNATGEEERRIKAFFEVQREALRKAGKTPEQIVMTFSEGRKKNPNITAADFGVPADFQG